MLKYAKELFMLALELLINLVTFFLLSLHIWKLNVIHFVSSKSTLAMFWLRKLWKNWNINIHSSDKRGLRSTFWPREKLQNLCKKKTQVFIFFLHTHSKFKSFSLGQKVECKPLFSEEWRKLILEGEARGWSTRLKSWVENINR